MKPMLSMLGALALLTGHPGVAVAAPTSPPTTPPAALFPPTAPATILESGEVMMPSAISGRTYRIDIYKPTGPVPDGGYPLVFLTDAELNFGTAVSQAATRQFENWRPAIIVGIGYSTTTMLDMYKTRARDLTPANPPEKTPGIPATDIGGGELFYRFITEELRPALAKAYPINAADQALYGYSFGGLFALDVLFRHPHAFSTYVISSPSIWWADRSVLGGEPAFEAEVTAQQVAPRILITAGTLEQTVGTPPTGADPKKYAEGINKSRMVDNARELYQRLSALKGAPGYTVKLELLDGEIHSSGMPTALSRGLDFVLARP